MEVRSIVAVSPNGIIAVNGNIPWKKSPDLKRFKARTMGGTLIMGRKTWDSIGHRKLPGRETIVLSRTEQEGVKTCGTFESALAEAQRLGNPMWVAGGGDIYELAMPFVSEIDLTVVTDYASPPLGGAEVIVFTPFVAGLPGFTLKSEEPNPEDPTLLHRLYVRT